MQRLTYGLLLNQNSLARGKTVECYFFVSLSKCFLARETVLFCFFFSISKERRRIEETVDRKQMMSVGFRSFPRSASSITKPAAHPSHIFFLWYAVSTFLFSLCCYIYFDVASSFLFCALYISTYFRCGYSSGLIMPPYYSREICPPGCWSRI